MTKILTVEVRDDLLTIDEAVKELKMCRAIIFRKMKDGSLPSEKIGNRRFVIKRESNVS